MDSDKPTTQSSAFRLPVAQMRPVFEPHQVQRKLDKLAERDYDTLRSTYERMLERGPQRFQTWSTCTRPCPTSMKSWTT
jgi:ATP-dependent Lon protease